MYALIFILVGAIFVFAAQNYQEIEIGFFHWRIGPHPFALFMFVAFGLGMILTGLFSTLGVIKLRAKLRKARKNNQVLEREIDALRNQPLYDHSETRPSEESTILDQEKK